MVISTLPTTQWQPSDGNDEFGLSGNPVFTMEDGTTSFVAEDGVTTFIAEDSLDTAKPATAWIEDDSL